MSNLAKLDFAALEISGDNYLAWQLDATIHLEAKGLGDTIKAANECSSQDKAKAMIFLRHHLSEALKSKYLTVTDPNELWANLVDRYDHQRTVILPKARYDWLNLRLQDYKSVTEYNSAMFRITSQMKLCGEKVSDEEMLEKKYSTFHANNIVLQTQYREKGFKKYSELISCLLVAEQNNELLLKNHEFRPTGSKPLPETNWSDNSYHHSGRGSGSYRGRGRGSYHNHGRGRGRGRGLEIAKGRGGSFKNTKPQRGGKPYDDKMHDKRDTSLCHRCGSNNHWARICRTPQHLVELYQNHLKNNVETNMMCTDEHGDTSPTHLETADFFNSPSN